MQYITKTITLTVTIPNTEAIATDYIQIFSNNGSGSVNLATPMSGKVASLNIAGAVDRTYTYSFRITAPALWKFKYTVYDAAGNAGTTSGEFSTDQTTLVPAKAPSLVYVSYSGTTKMLVLAA